MLEIWSGALERLSYEEAMDDPLLMAEYDARGRCVTGTVNFINLTNKEVKAGNQRQSLVPLLTVTLEGETSLLPGEQVTFAEHDKIIAELRAVRAGEVELAILNGGRAACSRFSLGDHVVFVALSIFGGKAPDSPAEIPWTHKDPSGASSTKENQADGSPDLSLDELARLPPGSGRDPDLISGVTS